MIQRLKELKWNLILTSLLYFFLGVALLIWPNTSNLVLCFLAASVLTAYGLFNILAYFLNRERTSWISLVIGIICLAFGLFSLLQPTRISDLISSLLGVAIMVDGVMSLRRDLELRANGFLYWWVPLILDILTLLLGVVVIFNPTLFASFLLQVIGLILIYESVSDLWTIHRLSVLARTAAQAVLDSDAIQGTVIDVEDDE